MLMKKGIENTMVQRVNEISENFIEANGQINNQFKFYQPGNSNVLNTPYQYDTEYKLFAGNINFVFDYQYSYNNYAASAIDALVTISTLIMMLFIIWKSLCLYVRYNFYKSLSKSIIQYDEQVQMQEGQLPQSKRQAHQRFAEKLSFSRLFFNQFQARKLQMIVNNAKMISEAEMSQTLEGMKMADQKIIEKSQENAQKFEQLN